MSGTKAKKQQVLIRVTDEMYEILFEDSLDETRQRRTRVSVPFLVVETLEWLQRWKADCPDAYNAVKSEMAAKIKR